MYPRRAHVLLNWFCLIVLLFTIACSSTINKSAAVTNTDSQPDAPNNDNQPDTVDYFTWTQLSPSLDSRLIYVSSTGNDNNDGFSPSTPKQTVAAGLLLLRDGYPDWLHFKRGDIFSASISNFQLSGRDADSPMVITYYGTQGDRPLFKTGNQAGFSRFYSNDQHDIAIVGLHFQAHTRNPYSGEYISEAGESGFSWVGGGNVERLLIEGCRFDYYLEAIVVSGGQLIHDVKLRGNVAFFSWAAFGTGQGFGQGAFLYNTDQLLLEGNYFIHNAGLINYPNDPDSIIPPGLTALNVTSQWFGHAIYLDNPNTNVTLKNNVIMGGDGVQIRSGGTVTDNLFLRTIVSLSGGNDDDSYLPAGISPIVQRNVFSEGTDWPASSGTAGERAFAIQFTNLSDIGGEISENLFVNDISTGPGGFAVHLKGINCDDENNQPVLDCRIRRANVEKNLAYNWRGGFWFEGVTGTEILNTTIHNNILVDDRSTNVGLMTLFTAFTGSGVEWKGNSYFYSGTPNNMFMNGSQSINYGAWVNVTGESGSSELSNIPTITYGIADYAEANGLPTDFRDFERYLADQSPLNWDSKVEAVAINQAFFSAYDLFN